MTARDSKEKSSSSLKSVLFILILGGMGVAVGYFIGNWMKPVEEGASDGPQWANILVLILLMPLSYYLAILLHELGHLLMGLVQKFTFAYLMVGPVMFRKVGKAYRFQRNRSFNLMGGFTAMLFPQEGDIRKKMIPYVAGGPFASLLTGVLGFVAFQAVGGTSGFFASDSLLTTAMVGFWGFFTLFSGFILLISLFPRRMGIVQTDGARLISLLSTSDSDAPEFLYYAHYQSSIGGTHPRDYDRARLQKVIAAGEETAYVPFVHLSLYLMEIVAGNTLEAAAHMENALEGVAGQNP
ncbi:MAG: M50 family metallopeptidase, partial [Bacteroidota bacterium]